MNKSEIDGLFEKYKFLVYKIASRFLGKYVEYDDLVQSGYMGLLKAINNFDKDKNFINYAAKYITYEIKEEIKKNSYFKVSDYLYKLGNKIKKIDSLDYEEISKMVNTSLETVILIKSNDFYTIDKIEDYEQFSSNIFKLPLGLTKQEEEILNMRVLYRYTQKEISKILNISQPKVSRILKKIVEKIC